MYECMCAIVACGVSAKPVLWTGLQTDIYTKFWTDLELCIEMTRAAVCEV